MSGRRKKPVSVWKTSEVSWYNTLYSTLRVLCTTYSQKSGPPLWKPLLKSVELTSACAVAYQVGLKVIFASRPPTRLEPTIQRLSVQAVLDTVASSRSV